MAHLTFNDRRWGVVLLGHVNVIERQGSNTRQSLLAIAQWFHKAACRPRKAAGGDQAIEPADPEAVCRIALSESTDKIITIARADRVSAGPCSTCRPRRSLPPPPGPWCA